ncbi:hypothetical protein Tco_1432671 [Tanacetum coccineum]
MRNKSDIDTLTMDDLYNNLKVYESEIKGQSSSSSDSQNMAFVSLDNSSSTNETVNAAHSVSVASTKDQATTTSYANDVMFSFFANQFNSGHAYYKGEEIHKEDIKESEFQWNRNCGYDWSFQADEGPTNFALMEFTSQGSSSSSSSNSEMILSLSLITPLIEEWVSDSEDENELKPEEVKKTVKPSFEKIEFINARNTTVEDKSKAEKPRKFSQSPRVNAAKQSSQRAATSVSVARHVNTIAPRPKVNNVTIIGPKAVVSAAKGNKENAVKSSAC